MEAINSKRELKRLITETFWNEPEDNIEFPKIFLYCDRDSLENPFYKITIEKIEKDFFIDKNGQRWIKEKK